MTVCTIGVNGTSYLMRSPGGLIGKCLEEGEPYEAKVLHHIFRQNLSGLAIDVGAGIGNHSLFLACVCGLRVVAFEPIDYHELVRNVELNQMSDRIRPWRLALGQKAGRAQQMENHQLRTSLTGPIAVGVLDEFNLQDVCLIKIDVEQMEPDVLLGAVETIKRERPVLYVEAWDEEAHAKHEEILKPLRYDHVKTFGATPLEEWVSCP